MKKFVEIFFFYVLFLENVNSSYLLGGFKVFSLNFSEGEIVEVWVSDLFYYRCFKNVIKYFFIVGFIVRNGFYRF